MLKVPEIGMFFRKTAKLCGQLYSCQLTGLVPRLLLMLALADTLHLLSSALTFSVANLWSEYAARAWYYVVPVSLPLAQTTMTASVYLTVSLTVERYVSVVKPFFHLKNKLGARLLSPPRVSWSGSHQVPEVLGDPGAARPPVLGPLHAAQLLHADHQPPQ